MGWTHLNLDHFLGVNHRLRRPEVYTQLELRLGLNDTLLLAKAELVSNVVNAAQFPGNR